MNEALHEAEKLFESNTPKPAPTLSLYQQEQERILPNLERLRFERLQREAAAHA